MIESVLEPLFHVSSLAKTWTIAEVGTNFVISNSHLEAESISLYESICDETTGLDIGRCSSARFSFTTLDIDLELINKVFDVSFTFESEPNTPFVVGRFKVVEDRPSLDRRNRTVVMYDALYDVLNTNYASWYNNLTWTGMTLGGFIDSFLSHVGITAETASRAELINASMPIAKTLQTNELSGSTILHAVCEVAGCFGVMTRDNKFRFLYLKSDIEGLFPANDLYPAEDLYPIEPVTTRIDQSEYYPPLWYETYRTPSISKLFITESADSLGTVVGSGDAEYDIVGNFLLFGKEAQELNTIGLNTLSAISGRVYRPFSVSKMGNLCFELGDPIRMSNDRMSVESYILERTFRGTQGFIDDISAEGVQSYTQNVKSANTTYEKLQSKTLVIEKSVDGLSSRLTYELDDTIQGSYAWQTAREIGAKVDETHGNQTTGFSWVLTSSGHTWYKDNTEVMKIDGTGLSVKGSITAGSTITGATLTSVDSDDTRRVIISDGKIQSENLVTNRSISISSQSIAFYHGTNFSGQIQTMSDSVGNFDNLYVSINGKLNLAGSYGINIYNGTLDVSGTTSIEVGSSPVFCTSFRQLTVTSDLTGNTINLQDNILTPISNIGSTAISAIQSAGSISFNLNSFAQMSFYSNYSSRTVTLNWIISNIDDLLSRVTTLENA